MTLENLSFAAQFGGTIGFGDADTEVSKVVNIAVEALKAAPEALRNAVKIVGVPSNATGSYGAMALVYETEKAIYIHALLIERACLTKVEETPINVNGQQITLTVTVGDTYTADYRNAITAYVTHSLNSKKAAVAAGYQIVYAETEVDSTHRIAALLGEGVRAIEFTRNTQDPTAKTFCLADVQNKQNVRIVTHLSTDARVLDTNQMPIRADIALTLAYQEAKDSKNPTSQTKTTPVSSTAAYVDLIYTPSQAALAYHPYMPPTPQFIPRVTITQSMTHLPVSALEFSLLNIAAVTSTLNQQNFGCVWRNQMAKAGGINMRELGAIAYLAKNLVPTEMQGKAIDTSDVSELQRLIQTALNKGVVFSMDIRQGGAGNWVNELFLRAAYGDVAAANRIITAANNLTGQRFKNHFKGGLVVTPNVVVQPSGYYVDGVEREDASKLDLLAMLNIFGSTDPNVVNQFLNATMNTSLDTNLRMYQLTQLLTQVVKGYKVKAYSTKITFAGEFIAALCKAVAECGVSFTGNSLNRDGQQPYMQTADQWSAMLVDPSATMGLFNHQTPTASAVGGFSVGAMGTFY